MQKAFFWLDGNIEKFSELHFNEAGVRKIKYLCI